MTDKEIVERAKEAEKKTGFGKLVHSPISKGVNSAFGIGFIEGMEEYRNSLQEEPVSIWHDSSKEYPLEGKEIIVLRDDEIYYGKYIGGHRYVRAEIQLTDDTAQTYAIIDYLTKKDKWIYVEDLLKIYENRTC